MTFPVISDTLPSDSMCQSLWSSCTAQTAFSIVVVDTESCIGFHWSPLWSIHARHMEILWWIQGGGRFIGLLSADKLMYSFRKALRSFWFQLSKPHSRSPLYLNSLLWPDRFFPFVLVIVFYIKSSIILQRYSSTCTFSYLNLLLMCGADGRCAFTLTYMSVHRFSWL